MSNYTHGKESMRTAAYEWGFEKGEQAERERILSLLDSKCNCHPDSAYCWAAKAIALIMGDEVASETR